MKLKYLLVLLVVLGVAVGCEKKESTEKKESKWITPSNGVCKSNGGEVDSDGCKANWENAKKICSASGGGNLPSIDELKKVVTDCGGTIVDSLYSRIAGSVFNQIAEKNKANKTYQSCYKNRGFISNFYWSYNSIVDCEGYIWVVGFQSSFVSKDGETKDSLAYVRCVRDGQ